MRTSLMLVSGVATLAATVSFSCSGRPSPPQPPAPAAHAEGTTSLGRLPVAFVPNLGQWEHSAQFVAQFGAMTVFLEARGWTFTLVERRGEQGNGNASARGVAVRMTFAGGSAPQLVAEERRPGRHNYFLGNDAARWRSDVPLYASVRYRDVHPGVDVRAREHDGHFEYDLLLQPGADLERVELAVEGIERMRVDGDALVLETRLGPVRMPAPPSWEEGPAGEKHPVTCRYVLRGEDRFGFEVPARRPGWALVIDPGLVWSTFLGGTGGVQVFAVAVAAQGAATIAGSTGAPGDFPTTPGAFDPSFNGGFDAFVTRLSPTGSSLVYSTFLGGMGFDHVRALVLDAQGAATVVGSAASPDFPTTPGAFDTSYNGGRFGDAFVTRLAPTGSSLIYSTFLGGTWDDSASSLALDAQGAATVAGWTFSADFPTTPGAFDRTHDGGNDAFVTRLAPTGSSLIYSTFLGGTGFDGATAIGLGAQGTTTVAGFTSSAGFPTTPGAFDTTHNGSGTSDAFVTQLSPAGSSLVSSTFLGGLDDDLANALALDAQGAVTVAGYTLSTDFPTTPGAFDRTLDGGSDGFVTRLSPTGASQVYSTFLGGEGEEWVNAIALDALGATTVAGRTRSTGFPTTPGAFDTSYNGSEDAFVSRLSPTGSRLFYSTFLGGTTMDADHALALDAQGAATVAGYTLSNDFPTTPGAFDRVHNGYFDGFVTRLDMLPTGATTFGRSSSGCSGALAISVTSMPRVGNAGFGLTCGHAPPNAAGLVALTDRAFATPVAVLGAEVWVDPTLLFVQVPASSNNLGASEVALPIANGPWLRGTRLFAQFFWIGPTAPPPCPPQGLSASNALQFTIQP